MAPTPSPSEPTPVGTLPPVGQVPEKMYAQVIRQGRFGDPRTAFQIEVVDVPHVLVAMHMPKSVVGG